MNNPETFELPCPFCGELMSSPIKFCVSCGRAITQDDMNRAGLKMNSKRVGEGAGRFALAKKEYSFHRQMRSTFLTVSAVLALVIGYYFTMHYVLHEPLPFGMDATISQLISGTATTGAPESTALQQPAAQTAP